MPTEFTIQHGERLAVIEERIKHIADALDKHIIADEKVQASVEQKLDEILALKNKGTGFLWFILAAISLVGGIIANNFVELWKGFSHG